MATIGDIEWPADLPLPKCNRCYAGHEFMTGHICRNNNPNGNAGRSYVKCGVCTKFIAFADLRGITPGVLCFCKEAARSQVAGRNKVKTTSRGIHYVCASGRCRFYGEARDEDGNPVVLREEELKDDLLEALKELKIV